MPRLLIGCALVAASLVAGCGGRDDEATTEGTRTLEVPAEAAAEPGKLTTEAAAGDVQGIDLDEYDTSIQEILS